MNSKKNFLTNIINFRILNENDFHYHKDAMTEIWNIFQSFLKRKNLKYSDQRKTILETFTKSEKHVTTEELYLAVRKRNPAIGYTTVHRTLKLLCESGLAYESKFEDGVSRYELKYGNEHHDHLICTNCGTFIEVVDPRIEELQKKLAEKYEFNQKHHRLEIYGICKKCRDSKNVM